MVIYSSIILSNIVVTFSEETIKLTSGIFQQWFINKSTDNSNAGSDDDLLFFVRNSVEKVLIRGHTYCESCDLTGRVQSRRCP